MTASADIMEGEVVSLAQIHDTLARAGVVLGIDEAGLARLASSLEDPQFSGGGYVMARGEPPTRGRPARFEPAFAVGIRPGHVRDDGSMDFLERELLKPVAEGEEVGRLHPAVPGHAGFRVDGTVLDPPPVPITALRFGDGVQVASGGEVYALRPGVLLYVPDKSLDVVQHHEHGGPVDLRSGNLDMRGSLVVRGNVEREMSVRATGDIDIRSGVEAACVVAGGSVRIKLGVLGGDQGVVSAEGDLFAHHAERAHLVCGGTLTVVSAVNCQLAAGTIVVTGALRGGVAEAETSLAVQEAGAKSGTQTVLAAASPLDRSLLEWGTALAAEKERRRAQHLHRGLGRGGFERGKLARRTVTQQREELARKVDQATRREALLPDAQVQVVGIAHAGVVIQLGVVRQLLLEEQTQVRFSYDSETGFIRTERLP